MFAFQPILQWTFFFKQRILIPHFDKIHMNINKFNYIPYSHQCTKKQIIDTLGRQSQTFQLRTSPRVACGALRVASVTVSAGARLPASDGTMKAFEETARTSEGQTQFFPAAYGMYKYFHMIYIYIEIVLDTYMFNIHYM